HPFSQNVPLVLACESWPWLPVFRYLESMKPNVYQSDRLHLQRVLSCNIILSIYRYNNSAPILYPLCRLPKLYIRFLVAIIRVRITFSRSIIYEYEINVAAMLSIGSGKDCIYC